MLVRLRTRTVLRTLSIVPEELLQDRVPHRRQVDQGLRLLLLPHRPENHRDSGHLNPEDNTGLPEEGGRKGYRRGQRLAADSGK